jgi:hypothetical protein
MVLDGEQDKSVRVLLKQRLISLNSLDVKSSLRRLSRLLCSGLGGRHVDYGVRDGSVLFAGSFKIELLDGGIIHLEVL